MEHDTPLQRLTDNIDSTALIRTELTAKCLMQSEEFARLKNSNQKFNNHQYRECVFYDELCSTVSLLKSSAVILDELINSLFIKYSIISKNTQELCIKLLCLDLSNDDNKKLKEIDKEATALKNLYKKYEALIDELEVPAFKQTA